jgi:hypothetical protein
MVRVFTTVVVRHVHAHHLLHLLVHRLSLFDQFGHNGREASSFLSADALFISATSLSSSAS